MIINYFVLLRVLSVYCYLSFFHFYFRYYLKERAFHGTLVQDEEAEVSDVWVGGWFYL